MKQQQFSYSGLSILLLFVCLIAINVVGYFLPMRLDITEERLFTISEGTQKVLEQIEDPITLKFYFSRSNSELPPQFKVYAQRVQEVLQEYVEISEGKITLQVFDPKPDSEEEEWANKYGIAKAALPSGNALYFGMVAIALDQEEVIPFFNLQREQFLEYDLSQTLWKVSQSDSPKVGVLSSLPVMGAPAQFGQGAPEWALISELQKTFDVQNLDTNLEHIDPSISLLIVIHPQGFSDTLQYAIDQYVLNGGRLVLLVDPSSRLSAQQQAGGMPNMQPQVSSDLPKLLKSWGVTYNASKLVGDMRYATRVNAGPSGVVRYPLWMSLKDDVFDAEHPVTTQLESMIIVEAGQLMKAPGSAYEFTPLLSSSPESGELDAMVTRFGNPATIARNLKVDNQPKTLAALVQGTFKTAFPDGPPPTEENKTPSRSDHLSQAKEANSILIVSDSDFASDAFSVQRMNFLGRSLVQPTSDNLNFILNAVEFLSGNQNLMQIRSRGRFSRPFTRVAALQEQAQQRFQTEEAALQNKLNEVRERLRTIEQSKGEGKQLILSMEQQAEIKEFREEERKTRRRLREVRKSLRQDIESLGYLLAAINLLAVPGLVAAAGLIFYFRRTRRMT